MSMIGAPNNLSLDTIDVYYEDTLQEYFDIQGLNYPISYGKHFFTISYKDAPTKLAQLKHNSKVLFEIRDSNGTLLNSGVTDYDDISGGGPCYLWIEQKLYNLSTNSKEKIADGKAQLIIVGELNNVPNNWKDRYNIRCIFEFDIQKGFYNKSDIVFYKKPTFNISESLELDTDNQRIKRSYAKVQMDNLLTWGGKVDYAEIYQKSSNQKSNQYSLLDTFKLEDRGSEHLVNWKRVNDNNELEGTTWIGEFGSNTLITNANLEFLKYWQYTGSHTRQNLKAHLNIDETGDTVGLSKSMVFKKVSSGHQNAFYRWVSNRRTKDDEVLDFKFTVSGSLSLIVYASHNQHTLNFGTSHYTGSDHCPPTEIYRKDYKSHNPSESFSTGPLVDGEYRTDLPRQYYESNQITIPSSSYYSVTIFHSSSKSNFAAIGQNIDLVNTGSIKNISLKERPPIGTNPNFYNHVFPMKTFRRDDKIQYKLQFLNADKKPVQVLSSSIDERYKKFELDSKFELQSDVKDIIGPPLIVQKDDNLLSGSIKIGRGVSDAEHYAVIGYDAEKEQLTFEKDTDPTGKGEVTDRIIFDQSSSRSLIHLSGSNSGTTAIVVSSGSTNGATAVTVNPHKLQFVHNDADSLFSMGSFLNRQHTFFINPGSNVTPMTTDSNVGIIITGSVGDDDNRVGVRKLNPEATLHVGGNLIVDGNIQSTQFTSSIISSSTILTSGSTIFGDEFGSSDTHQFFGNITASANISVSGNFIGNFPDTNDDALHYPLVTTGQNGTIESQNALKVNPSSNEVRVASIGSGIGQFEHIFFSTDLIQVGATGLGAGVFRVDGHSSQGTLFVTSSGQVGIGGWEVPNAPTEPLSVIGNISSSGDLLKTKFVQMTNSSSVIDTFNTGSFRSAKYTLQVTSASKYQVSEMLVLHNDGTALNTEYAQINSDKTFSANFSTDVNGANVRLIASSSFISCSVRYDRTIIPT